MWFWEKYTTPWSLSQSGILGMNKRNHSYISRYNPRSLYPLVDDKLQTKRIALDAGVTVPELIGTIRAQHDVSRITELVKDWP
ncbi:TPA: sugar-transfer associated ATP-grasp domain-containing protein, partial [Aeromonas hydrophila]